MTLVSNRAAWHEALAVYAQPRLRRGLLDIIASAVPYLALCVAIYLVLRVSPLLALALMIPTAGFLVRVFVVFHDCTHDSLLPSRRANRWAGRVLGLLVLSPFYQWRREHAGHHATSGDLDRRGEGDVETLTVAELSGASVAGSAGLPAVSSPCGDVRARPGVRHDHRAAASASRHPIAAA